MHKKAVMMLQDSVFVETQKGAVVMRSMIFCDTTGYCFCDAPGYNCGNVQDTVVIIKDTVFVVLFITAVIISRILFL